MIEEQSPLWPPEYIESLRTRFGFPPNFSLHSELEDAARYYRSGIADAKKKPLSKQKKTLEELITVSERFSALLQSLCSSDPELYLLFVAQHGSREDGVEKYAGLFSFSLDLIELSKSAKAMQELAITAFDMAKTESQSKKPSNLAIKRLIAVLRDVYTKGTGKVDRQSSGDETSGCFLTFVHEVAQRLGYKGSKKYLANLISAFVPAVDEALKHRKVSAPQ